MSIFICNTNCTLLNYALEIFIIMLLIGIKISIAILLIHGYKRICKRK